ncbi:MAG TPA: DUF4215 domain-containing protein [Kofleriaceae bacterium]
MRNQILWTVVIELHVAAAVTAGGCLPSLGVACGSGWCSDEEICLSLQAAQPVCIRGTCGNGHLDSGEECDDWNHTGGDGCSPNCMIERCGDGIMQTGEQCDDGNTIDGDGCSASCTTELCGNGILDRAHGEQCDDGNTIDGDGCSAHCRLPSCGTGSLDLYEQCDDGNTIDGDGCSANCTIEICGNGILDRAYGEQCDDGNTIDGDGCSASCRLPSCGNGSLDLYEQCDDGNTIDGDGCSANCTTEVCGNGILDHGEQCDDSNTANGDGCSANCTIEACGNDILDLGEQCDDGNTTDGDCCSAHCTLEFCGNNSCKVDKDCAPAGICDTGGLCRVARSCAEILQHFPASKDGVYSIAPGTTAPFSTVCDMTRDRGGWTLLLKATGDTTLGYSASAWTDDSLLNASDLTTQPGNAKYRSFLSLPVTTLRGELDGFRYTKNFPGKTAQQIFQGPDDYVNGFPTFNSGALYWSTQPFCQIFGVNTPFTHTQTRFGWSANEQNDCTSNDTAIGLGLMNDGADHQLGTDQRGAGYECLGPGCKPGFVDTGGHGLLWGHE